MSFTAIFSREFRLRRILLVGALLVGVAAVVIPRLQGKSGSLANETAAQAALLLTLVTCALFAVVLGAGAVARDLSDGRLNFDFVRPTSTRAIWGGRFGAALLLLITSAVLILAPSLLLGGRFESPIVIVQGLDISPASFAVLAIFCGTFLLLAIHVGASLFASRSPWLGFDLAALCVTGLLVGSAISRLDRHGVRLVLAWGGIAFAVFATLILVLASYVQMSRGRTDLARGHRTLSVVLWSGLLLGAVALEATSRWAVTPKLGDLVNASEVLSAPRGDWFFIAGRVRGRGPYRASFLANAATGRSVRLPNGLHAGWLWASVSTDGSRAVWQALEGRGKTPYSIWGLDLTREGSRPEELLSGLPAFWTIALSPTGRWCAITTDSRLLVFEFPIRRLVASFEVSSDLQTVWVGTDELRLFRRSPTGPAVRAGDLVRVEISEVKLPLRQVKSLAVIEDTAIGNAWGASVDGSTVVLSEHGKTGRRLFDAVTGAELARIALPENSNSAYLSDGTLVVFNRREGRLVRWNRKGEQLSNVEVSPSAIWSIGGLAAPDLLLASKFIGVQPTHTSDTAAWSLQAIDLRSGRSTSLGKGLPAGLGRRIEAGQLGARLVDFGGGKLGVFNPKISRVEPLVVSRTE